MLNPHAERRKPCRSRRPEPCRIRVAALGLGRAGSVPPRRVASVSRSCVASVPPSRAAQGLTGRSRRGPVPRLQGPGAPAAADTDPGLWCDTDAARLRAPFAFARTRTRRARGRSARRTRRSANASGRTLRPCAQRTRLQRSAAPWRHRSRSRERQRERCQRRARTAARTRTRAPRAWCRGAARQLGRNANGRAPAHAHERCQDRRPSCVVEGGGRVATICVLPARDP